MKLFIRALAASALIVFSMPTMAATTGMVFAGGCVEDPRCAGGANATPTTVADVLSVLESDVTQITSGFSYTGVGAQSGTWSVTDSSITHLAFKSNGYFILGEVTAASGDWDNDTMAAGGWDITLVDCPVAICGTERAYDDPDFRTNGGQIANLSNVRAFSVVPVPAAVWLFGSALGMLGWIRRRSVTS